MIKKPDIKKFLKRKEIAIPLVFIAVGIIAVLIWLLYTYGTVRTDNAKIDSNIIYIYSDTSGILSKLPKNEFEAVYEGETLAQIDPLIGPAERLKGNENMTAFSTLSGMKQEIESLTDTLMLSEKNYARKKALFDAGGISKMEFDSETTSLSVLRDQLKSAKDLYDMARSILAVSEADTPTIPLKSPITGRFAKKLADVGELVVAGQPVCAVVDISKVWVTAKINEDALSKIKIGQPVKIKVDNYPGEVFRGKVLDIGVTAGAIFSVIPQDNPSGNFVKVTQTVPIRISIDTRGFVLRPGTNVSVTIYTNK